MKIRLGRPDDVKFVLDTWSKSFRNSPWAGVIPNNLWHEFIRELITQLLARGAVLHVAVDDTDDAKILGWACTEERGSEMVLHYAYVRPEHRAKKVASRLLDVVDTKQYRWFYTCRTVAGRYLAQGMVWAPEIARRQ